MTALTLTQSKDGGYRFHRETCKKIADRPTYSPEEIAGDDIESLVAATAASCCKPSADAIAAVKESVGIETEPLADHFDHFDTEAEAEETVPTGDLLDLVDEEPVFDPEAEDEDDLLGEDDTDEDLADLVGGAQPTEWETTDWDAGQEIVKASQPAPIAKVTISRPSSTGREMEVVQAVADILGIDLVDGATFPGHGKAIKVKGGGSVYLNSKNYADVRANSLATAKAWVDAGLVTARGGNYVRISVQGL